MAATEALVFDAIRTPRGKGKVNGSLHATKPVDLVVGLMHEMLGRNAELDPAASTTSCSAASRRSATRAATSPRPRRSRPACPTPSPASSSTASAPRAWRRSTSPPRRSPPAGRTWCSPAASSRCRACRWAPTAAPGRWTRRPTYDTCFVPQGIGADLIATIEGFSRDDVDAYAARRRSARPSRAGRGPLRQLGRPGASTATASSCSTTTSSSAPAPPSRRSASSSRRSPAIGEHGRLRRRRAAEVPLGREDQPRPHAGQLLGHRRRRRAGRRSATSETGDELGLTPARPDRRHRGLRRRPDDHAHRPGAGRREGAGQGRPDRRRHRPVRDQRGVRRRRPAVRARHGPRHGEGQRQRRRHRHGPPARRHRRA